MHIGSLLSYIYMNMYIYITISLPHFTFLYNQEILYILVFYCVSGLHAVMGHLKSEQNQNSPLRNFNL